MSDAIYIQRGDSLLDALLEYVKNIVADAITPIKEQLDNIETHLNCLEETIETLKKP